MAGGRAAPSVRHIVITGASSGIGAGLARRYARSGSVMSLLGRDPSRTEAVARQCVAAGATAFAEVGDVTDSAFMTDWLGRCDERTPVDFIIANAGIGGRLAMPWGGVETVAVAN